MKTTILAGVITASFLLASCGRKDVGAPLPGTAPAFTPAAAPADAAMRSPAVFGPVLAAWTLGNKSGAVDEFVAADWAARPLFPVDSAFSLSEEQFKALSDADRAGNAGDMSATLNAMRGLEKAVLQAGRDAAAKGDADRAGKCFTAVKACGAALGGKGNLAALVLLGQAFQADAGRELAGR